MMQAAQPERDFDWSEEGVRSTNQFLARLKEMVAEFDGEASGSNDAVAQYVADEIDAAVAVASDEYDDLTFDEALREAQSLVRTLRQYSEYADVHAETFERGLDVAVRLLAPVAPHLAEELYDELGGEGFVAEVEWPGADVDRETVERRRNLVENTREDVRQIVDVAGIEDPERIDVVVTPEWKYDALSIAIESDADNLISELMQNPEIREQGDDAADYGQDLQAEREALSMTLGPDDEYEALEAAAWLIEREFDAPVAVVRAEEADDDVVRKAEPGRPAIDIVE
jgi:leucyl-tRNA synthetase